jgi:flavin reductase (DIM6/NTAB) family NADH-FMN oxidoreductase RutF
MILHHLTRDDIQSLNQRYKTQLINSLSGFKSVNLIGTHDSAAKSNLAIISSVVHLGTSPALVGFVMRPDNGERHTLDNIINSKHYTINQVSTDMYQKAHQCSARYPRQESEFNHSGLSAHYIGNISAPFVRESQLKYAVQLKEIVPITLNNTTFIIGEIIHIICDEKVIQPDGYIDIEALNTASLSGLDSYHSSTRLSRLSYAKPDILLEKLSVSGSTAETLKEVE